jgi:hypothetical protein
MTVQPLPSFGAHLLGTFLRPGRTFSALLDDPRRLRLGMWAMALIAFLYTLVYIDLVIGGGAPSTFKPFLDIPAEVYYRYNVWFLAPSMFGGWILAAGVAHLLSKPFGGKGAFEDTLSTLGFATLAATLAAVAHDLPQTFLGAIGVLDQASYEAQMSSATPAAVVLWIFYGLFGLLFLVLYPKAVGAAQRLKPAPAILIGLLAFVVYQGVFLIFNR